MANDQPESAPLKTLVLRAAMEKFAELEPFGDLSSRDHVLTVVRAALEFSFDLSMKQIVEELREHYKLFIEDYMTVEGENLQEKTRIYAEGIEDAIALIEDIAK